MAEVKNYKRKPIVVQAIQFTGDNFDDLKKFANCNLVFSSESILFNPELNKELTEITIETPEGIKKLKSGDYLIKEPIEEIYHACEERIFTLLYENTTSPFKLIFQKTKPIDQIEEYHNEEN